MTNASLPPPLPRLFYDQPTLDLARALLGKTLWRHAPDGAVGGVIVETEAYIAAVDPASHNYRRPSKRAVVMYGPPGHAYVYFTYGMHYCLNVVSEVAGVSGGILLRALAPLYGQDVMAARSPAIRHARDLARGPGRLCRAMAITLADNGADLTGDALWIADGPPLAPDRIASSPRIGISQGTDLPWRFFLKDCAAVSGTKRQNASGPLSATP